MKKIIYLLGVITLMASLMACSANAQTGVESETATTVSQQEETTDATMDNSTREAEKTSDKTGQTISGEIVRFVSDFNGSQATLLGLDVMIEDGSEVFFDIDNITYTSASSSLIWQYVYANEHSSVVSDIVCAEGSSIAFTMADGSEVVFEVGAQIDIQVDEQGDYYIGAR